MSDGPLAVLDANVLFPFHLRNLLLHSAAGGLFQPLWSDLIIDECMRALRRDADLTELQCTHLVAQLRRHFPHAWRVGFAHAADGFVIPDEGDRHVLALAVRYEAEFIVTHNLKHFPAAVLHPLGTTAIDPDTFIRLLWLRDSRGVLLAAERHRTSLQRDPLSPEEYLDTLAGPARLPHSAALLKASGFLDAATRSLTL